MKNLLILIVAAAALCVSVVPSHSVSSTAHEMRPFTSASVPSYQPAQAPGWREGALAVFGGSLFALGAVRTIRDVNLSVTKALPAANASASSDAIFIGANLGGGPGPIIERFELEIAGPAVANLVDAHTITYTIEDSADGAAFAAVPELATFVQTGAGGVGAAAATRTVPLPSSVRAYVRVTAAVANGGGDNTASSFTVSLLG